jgi:hypothetical protein
MERRFDMSDFEQSLKDHADQFKMTPSKRVWNGVYNNLHPGSKWPSITVAVVFIITLVTIGSLNNSTIKLDRSINTNTNPATNTSKSGLETQTGEAFAPQTKSRSNSAVIDLEKNTNSVVKDEVTVQRKNASDKVSSSSLSIVVNNLRKKNNGESNIENNLPSGSLSTKEHTVELPDRNASSLNSVNEQKIEVSVLQKPVIPQATFAQQQERLSNDLIIPVSYQFFSVPSSAILADKLICVDRIEPVLPNQNDILSENTAINANKIRKKKNNKIEWTFYVNPTISTVSFNKKTIQPSNNPASLVVLSSQPSFKMVHNPRFGVETGAEMTFQVAKKLQFITGVNLSYSGYNNVSNLVHPTFATLNLNDNNGQIYSKTYITHYGNGQSQDHINLVNYSIEASIPLGLQYNIWKSQKIKIDVSSLLEPSVVMRDDAYLISSDGRYYVNDPLLVRRTNVDGHFGSYITFIGKKIKWHLGPDFRYQLLSTYKNIYPTKEHLIDYGIRIGISK